MELKGPHIGRRPKDSQFQSHLYGIERCLDMQACILVTCFNRTFMELKDDSHLLILVASPVFQSHLYGIERDELQGDLSFPHVSIAPLWN